MRLFFGFDLGPAAKSAIADWRDRCARAEGRPVSPANFHITLAFVGELQERKLEQLCDRVDAWQESQPARSASITLDQVGFWPAPGIYWLGSSADTAALGALAGKLQGIGQAFGARRERRRYVPHVTLFRGCDTAPPAPVSAPHIEIPLGEITLFESQRGHGAMHYLPIASWTLG